MAVNLIDSNDIQISQTGNNIELQIDSDIKNAVTQNTSDIADAQQDITNLENGNVYSTSEVKTNKIYKGKPVYRKMWDNITLEDAPSAKNKTLGAITNFKESVMMYGEIKTPTSVIYCGYASNVVYISPFVDASGNAKIIYVYSGTGQKGKAIFEYTKTTD